MPRQSASTAHPKPAGSWQPTLPAPETAPDARNTTASALRAEPAQTRPATAAASVETPPTDEYPAHQRCHSPAAHRPAASPQSGAGSGPPGSEKRPYVLWYIYT